MTKHKTEDYKISAVKYYLNNDKGDGYKKTCKIFDCKKSTLRDWIKRYKTSKNLIRRNRKSVSYKITKLQVKTALELLKQNEQLTMNELAIDMKKKYPTFYEKYIFRKLRLQSYRNTKRSEQKMLNNFKQIFGNEKNVIICFGDYEQKYQMKFKEATKGKGMRTLFRKAGFQTYLVDEFRTSCMCSKCEIGICKKTMVRENPKPYRSGNVLIHGLICCKNGCGYWNRDVNGATNIYKIAYNVINNKERPNYLSRSKNLSGSLDELPKPKFTRSSLREGKPF